jgi:hypothetical protein
MLKRFFYAAASILMLAVAYHLGATNAQGQVGGNMVAAGVSNTQAVTFEGEYYQSNDGINFRRTGNIYGGGPAYSRPVSVYYGIVMLENGDLLESGDLATWTRTTNVFSGPTPAAHVTFGRLKAQYRK